MSTFGRVWMFKAVEILPVLGTTSQYVLFQADGDREKDEDLVQAAITHLKGFFHKRGRLVKLPFGLGDNMGAWPCDPAIPIRPGLCPLHWELTIPLRSGERRQMIIRVDFASFGILNEAVQGIVDCLNKRESPHERPLSGYALVPVSLGIATNDFTEETLIQIPGGAA